MSFNLPNSSHDKPQWNLTVSENRKPRDEFDVLENCTCSKRPKQSVTEWAKSYENSSKALFRKPTKSQCSTTVADDQVAEQIFQFCIAPGGLAKEVITSGLSAFAKPI